MPRALLLCRSCEDSCRDGDRGACGDTPNGITVGFPSCLDPEYPPYYFPPALTNCSAAPRRVMAENFRDGVCNTGGAESLHLNTADCSWDGGDCCAQTCKGPDAGQCGSPAEGESTVTDFVCRDPAVMDAAENGGACTVSKLSYVGDSYCDGGIYNVANCGWDGGDWYVYCWCAAGRARLLSVLFLLLWLGGGGCCTVGWGCARASGASTQSSES